MKGKALLVALLLGVPGAARAQPAQPDLRLRRLPAPEPTSLSIREPASGAAGAAGGQAEAGASGERGPAPRSPSAAPERATVRAPAEDVFARRSLKDRLVLHLNLGVGLDSGEPKERPRSLGGAPIPPGEFQRLRALSYGEAMIGTRGLVAPSLSTYFASQFRFDQSSATASAIPTVHDRTDDVLVRSAYVEADEFLKPPYLRPLFVRAGRMFKYGPAIAHIDGVNIGYDLGWLSLSAYSGRRVSLYRFSDDLLEQPTVLGFESRLDLYELRAIPAVVTARGLSFNRERHLEAGAAYQYSRDILLGADLRFRNGKAARQALSLRARVSDVTTVSAELENRSGSDWVYDLLAGESDYGAGDPRHYLSLGPPLPRIHIGVRAGTVVLDNIDLLLRAAGAIERDGQRQSATSPSYLELGGAADVRLRRRLRVGSSMTLRRYRREEGSRPDRPDHPDPLPEMTRFSRERSFAEGGLTIGYSLGARVFSATVETYGRAYNPGAPYELPERLTGVDYRSGGRFRVEGWAQKRFRLKGEYDVSFSRLHFAPELRTLKSLRVLAEGTF